MKTIVTATVATLVALSMPTAQAGTMTPYWSNSHGDFGVDVGRSLAVDGAGNVIVVGSFEGSVDFGGGDLVSAGGEDIFIAKYNQYGTHLWSQRFGSIQGDQGVDVAVDNAGSIFVTGYFGENVDFGGAAMISAGGRDVFVAKYAATGTHVWSASYGSSFGNDEGRSVALDGSGNLILAGEFGNTVNFGGSNHTSAGSADLFLAKYDTFGAQMWSLSFGDAGWETLTEVVADAAGRIFLVGNFSGSIDFGGGALVSAGNEDIFLAMFSGGGGHQWSRRFGDTAYDYGDGLAVDAAGNIVITGSILGVVDFGGGPLVASGGTSAFVASYTNGAAHRWSRVAGQSRGFDVATNSASDVLVTGQLGGTGDFGGGDLTSAGASDVFIAWYNADGDHKWSKRYGDAGTDVGFGIAVDPSENPIITGESDGVLNFGGNDLGGAGDYDLFIAKFFSEIAVGALDDCPNDRGRCATLLWYKHFLDGPPHPVSPPWPPVVRYSIWRAAGSLPVYPPDPICPGFAADDQHDKDACVSWKRVAVVVANGGEQYSVQVPTTRDAVPGEPAVHYFIIAAEDGEGGYHLSDPDSIATVNQLGAQIASITDVANDDGGRVNITFTRDSEDAAGAATPVQAYEVYRRDEPAPVSSAASEGSGPQKIKDWTFVGSAPALGNGIYGVEAATIGDSTIAGGDYQTTFFVRATTSAPALFFDTAPGNGYSLDNLAPSAPTALAYDAGTLSWAPTAAADFDYFTVYGASSNDFGSAVVVDYTTAATMDVTLSPYALFFVTATDESGNEGPPASLDSLSGTGGTPTSYVLSMSNYPNPFNPSTTIKYTLPLAGVVTIRIYDARGVHIETLIDDETRPAGAYSIAWRGRDNNGSRVAAGVYFARITNGDATRTRKMILLK